jgi:DNA gyrase inhibitor GyrI
MTNPQPQKQEIQIADNIPGAEYANAMQVNHSKDEFQIMFLSIMGMSGRVTGKVMTNPGHFKRMVNAMNENLKKYEDQFGEIKESAALEKEIGFKG